MADIKRVAWNASEGLIMEISNRRSSANTHFISGNLKRAFATLTAIKQSAIQSFDTTERKNLRNIEDKFAKISSALNSSMAGSFNKDERDLHAKAFRLCLKIYSEYNDMLMDLLERYGYLIGEQSDASKMKF